jgi:tetratricopeptide (TPR) repeat protein
MVAYRYGYVPPAELGGDGRRSITFLEVLAARAAGKPVFAFLIDPKADWRQPRESDLLEDAPEERHLEILAAVRGLKEFKSYLQANCTFDLFLNEDDLARKVATTLANHAAARPDDARVVRAWRPRVCYPLQPAPHFQGRRRLRERLVEWARQPGSQDRVVSLVAAGGTGKTALAQRFLDDFDKGPHAGVVVWSLYESPRTEEFLRVACEYFTGEAPSSAGGLLERLQTALSGDLPHLLVLDGLERVQAEGASGRPRGELEDPQMRRLLRWLAAGQGTQARALVTSRFPLEDLADWKGAGHREEKLDDLEPEAARAVLRGWGVRGDDATLDRLAAPLHCHALSVAVLGSYLGKLWAGDPSKAPTFDTDTMAEADPKAARLEHVLGQYAQMLPDAERDLLARLSTFPRGVTAERLGFVAEAGPVAGALAGCDEVRLLRLLEQLRDLGLVFRYETSGGSTFSAHPFLRDYFRGKLGPTRPEEVHEAVRRRLADLPARPSRKPAEPALLDRYEALIEHTRLAGRIAEAFRLYQHGLGSYDNLGWSLGDNARGLRIVSAFFPDGAVDAAVAELSENERAILVNSWGLYAECLGDLAAARRAFAVAAGIWRRDDHAQNLATALTNLAEVELLAGRLPAGVQAAYAAVEAEAVSGPSAQRASPQAFLAAALFRRGGRDEAWGRFALAAQPERQAWPQGSPYCVRDVLEAECRLAAGDRAGAKAQALAELGRCTGQGWTYRQALGRTLLGRIALPEYPAAARRHLDAARDYGAHSGDVEVVLRCHQVAAEAALAEQSPEQAVREAEAGVHLADSCGFGHYAIELRLGLSRAHLDAGDAASALKHACEALERSTDPECQYAWGEADALHLCGVAQAGLGEVDLARQRFTAALARREPLTHPGLGETRAALARLGA